MDLTKLVKIIDKIHQAFYDEKSDKNVNMGHQVERLYFHDEFIEVDNVIDSLRFRLTFPDYTGKIDRYRELFGYILKNGDNLCDTSDFILLTNQQATVIHAFIDKTSIIDLKKINYSKTI